MSNKKKNIFYFILIVWQLFFWFEFVPSNYSDPWTDPLLGPAADLAPGFYYILAIPVGILGVILSFITMGKKIEVSRIDKIINWVLLIVSICTAIPPIFAIVRYIFYPLVVLLGVQNKQGQPLYYNAINLPTVDISVAWVVCILETIFFLTLIIFTLSQ